VVYVTVDTRRVAPARVCGNSRRRIPTNALVRETRYYAALMRPTASEHLASRNWGAMRFLVGTIANIMAALIGVLVGRCGYDVFCDLLWSMRHNIPIQPLCI
jgi:hypothetical protein